jgi:hypothetical protein
MYFAFEDPNLFNLKKSPQRSGQILGWVQKHFNEEVA